MPAKTGPGITKTAPRILDKSAEWYKSTFPSLHAGLEYLLDAFPSLYQRTLLGLKGRFSRGELMLIIDVCNGLTLTPQLAGQHLAGRVADGIALEHLDERWGVSAAELNAKVAGLTIVEAACLELWAGAYWHRRPGREREQHVREMEEDGR